MYAGVTIPIATPSSSVRKIFCAKRRYRSAPPAQPQEQRSAIQARLVVAFT